MKFIETPLPGAFLVEIEPLHDERGFFARTVCREEFARRGLSADFLQQSISHNNRRGIVRGLHLQIAPHQEDKLVRVTAGAIYDVVVDLRAGSPTRGRWHAVELSAANRSALYIPRGLAHGFQTLTDNAEVFYQMTVPFHPQAARTIHWRDTELDIDWPAPDDAILSPRDHAAPPLSQLAHEFFP